MNIENFAKMRGFQMAYTSGNPQILDHMLASEEGDEVREKILTKRLQFDTTAERYLKVEQLCSLLNCSKREFLEMAVSDALDKAWTEFEGSFKEAYGEEFTTVYAPKEA